MAGLELDGLGAHSLGHDALKIGAADRQGFLRRIASTRAPQTATAHSATAGQTKSPPASLAVVCQTSMVPSPAQECGSRDGTSIEQEIGEFDAKKCPPLGDKEREQLMQLDADLERAWSHPWRSCAKRSARAGHAAAD